MLDSLYRKKFVTPLICLISGALAALSMAPYHFWLLLIPAFSLLYIAIGKSNSALQATTRGWWFGFGYFVIGLYWIGNALLVEGTGWAWAWPLAVTVLPAGLAIFTALACGLSKRFFNLRTPGGYLGFIAMMAVFEFLRGHIFTGFPWNLYGYAFAPILPIIQIVSLGSIYLLTLLTLLWLTWPGFMILSKAALKSRRTLSLVITCSFLITMCFGVWRLSTHPVETHEDIFIRIVQPNIKQSEKWKRHLLSEHFEKQLQLSQFETLKKHENPSFPPQNKKSVTYVIWPETALNSSVLRSADGTNKISQMLQSYPGTAYLLSGALRHNQNNNSYYNSLITFNDTGTIQNTYDKSHLVPFGEYIPFQKWINIAPIVQFSGFQHGPGVQTITTDSGHGFTPLICYEAIFPGKTSSFSPKNQNLFTSNFIVNITNDAWYGNSPGPYQHFTQARFRAIEEGIPLIRAANTGISGSVDSLGRIQLQADIFQEDIKTLLLPKKNRSIVLSNIHKHLLFFFILLLFVMAGYKQKLVATNND